VISFIKPAAKLYVFLPHAENISLQFKFSLLLSLVYS